MTNFNFLKTLVEGYYDPQDAAPEYTWTSRENASYYYYQLRYIKTLTCLEGELDYDQEDDDGRGYSTCTVGDEYRFNSTDGHSATLKVSSSGLNSKKPSTTVYCSTWDGINELEFEVDDDEEKEDQLIYRFFRFVEFNSD